jgi:AraC-like DNA-binding protein
MRQRALVDRELEPEGDAPRMLDWTGASQAQLTGFGPRWRAVAQRDLILAGVGHAMHAPMRRGALTAKFAFGGVEHYRVGDAALASDDDAWLVIGAGERYASWIPRGRPVATIAVFFDDTTVAQVRAVRRGSEPRLLDRPPAACDEPLPIGPRRLRYDPALADALARLAVDADPLIRGELHALVLDRLLDAAGDACDQRDRLACVRRRTRDELYRRLSRAHDRIMTEYAEPLALGELARTAAMATHHFLRRFHDAFGTTPHRALVARRIERGRGLLTRTDQPISAIARAVGFATVAAFSTRFRREIGVSPAAFRRRARSGRAPAG